LPLILEILEDRIVPSRVEWTGYTGGATRFTADGSPEWPRCPKRAGRVAGERRRKVMSEAISRLT
jgi:hypothetical protein